MQNRNFIQARCLCLQGKDDEEWDGVLDRDFIKHRTAKLLAAAARHQADLKKTTEGFS